MEPRTGYTITKAALHPELANRPEQQTISGAANLIRGQIEDATDKVSRLLGKVLGQGEQSGGDDGVRDKIDGFCLMHTLEMCVKNQQILLKRLDELASAIG